MRRSRAWATVLGACLGVACGPRAQREATPPGPPDPPARRPPGVALDPPFRLPAAAPSAQAESGLAVLAEPVDPRPARRTVDAFFSAVVRESSDELERVLEPAAHVRSSARARPEPALPSWRRRFERLDYTTLSSDVLYRPSEMQVHPAAAAAALAEARGLPMIPKGDELLVRVAIVAPRAANLFAGEIVMLLRRSSGGYSGGYRIGELFEDFRLP